MRNGLGTEFYATGYKFVGHWANDKKQGEGTLYDKSGAVVKSGVWTND